MTTTTIDHEVKRRIADIQRRDRERVEAEVRAEAEAQIASETAAAERQTRIAELRERIPVELDQVPLEAARTDLRAALTVYMAACRAHDQRFSDLWTEITNLAGSGPVPSDLGAAYSRISIGGKDYPKSRAQSMLATAALAAFREQYPREGFDLGRPQD
jgi:hypothetical protein